jgi:hypothetical protein
MALFALAVHKQTKFHDQAEGFDTVYYYQGPPQLGSNNFEGLMDQLVQAEKKVFSSEIFFTEGRVWTAGGTKAENETVLLKDLAGTGTMSAGVRLHAEACVMVEWECGRKSSVGRKVYLRKYLRSGYLPTGANGEAAPAKDALNAAAKLPYKTYADEVQRLDVAGFGVFNLSSPGLRTPKAASNGVVDQYVRTREFRRN